MTVTQRVHGSGKVDKASNKEAKTRLGNKRSDDMRVFGGDHGIEETGELETFIWTLTEEPHASRRKEIIAKHPEIRKLMGHEWRTKYIMTGLVLLQFACAYLLKDSLFTWKFWLVSYVIGATATQAIFLGIHEISHFLAFKKFSHNKAFAIFCNLPIGLPYFASFRGYHLEHHKFQGMEGVDTDVPTAIEAKFITSTFTKLLFCICQILFYALRPVLVRQQQPTMWHAINFAVQLSFDFLVVYFVGWGPIIYFLVSDFLAGSLHPCASHFIAEHYVFLGDYETYSYYGPLNALCFNVGYHNEHHDFPNVPWSRLPAVRKIASEYYDNLPQHHSWPLVMWKFITDPKITTKNRVLRKDKAPLSTDDAALENHED